MDERRKFLRPNLIEGTFLFDALETALRLGSAQELRVSANAHLWCLFVGAIAEWQSVMPENLRLRKAKKDQPEPSLENVNGSALVRVDSSYAEGRDVGIHCGPKTFFHIGPDEEDASAMRFNKLFASQANTMGLLSWEQVVPVLQLFAYGDTLQPHGSRWFWRATDGIRILGQDELDRARL